MTRLTSNDIENITTDLLKYDKQLIASIGVGLLGVACRLYGVDEVAVRQRMASFPVQVIPITAGQGIISQFAETVAAILNFLGISARVSQQTDLAGITQAYQERAGGIFMADDTAFVAINFQNGKVVDNSEATGRVYGTALSLLAGGIKDKEGLIIGCGPVGNSAAELLLSYGGRLTLYDSNPDASENLRIKLNSREQIRRGARVRVATNIENALSDHSYILDATPAEEIIPDRFLEKNMKLALPGVPPGISEYGFEYLQKNVVHDKLELGVAAMAVGLLL